jgi:molybdopterin/thiamine biosynthesis adenylyltransferase
MMKYVLRMRAAHHRRLAALLRAAMPSESVAFLLCRRSEAYGSVVYLADEVIEVDARDYAQQAHNIASVTPLAMARVAQLAREKGRVIVMAHLHPMTESNVGFSQADHIGNHRSFAFFHRRVPQPEHLALVWNARVDECQGLFYSRAGSVGKLDSIVMVDGDHWRQFVPEAAHPLERFDRQALLLGEVGQQQVGAVNIAVIGLGGTGSLSSMALIHHGVRRMTLVDDEMLDESNMPRIPACVPADVDRRSKVDIAFNYAMAHAPSAEVIPINKHVEHSEVLPYLVAVDLLVVCTDNTTSRAFLNQLSQQYLIPLLDLGVQFSVNEVGMIVNEIGRINLVRPGTPCLWCSGHINPARLAAESIPKTERQRAESYLRGMDDPQPSMLAFNMEVVGRGMQVLIGFITGLFSLGIDVFEQRSFLKAKGGLMSRQVLKVHRSGCPICGADEGVGCGEDAPMQIKKRAT